MSGHHRHHSGGQGMTAGQFIQGVVILSLILLFMLVMSPGYLIAWASSMLFEIELSKGEFWTVTVLYVCSMVAYIYKQSQSVKALGIGFACFFIPPVIFIYGLGIQGAISHMGGFLL